ncbi:hypothetical protein GGS23DRAFT_614380 [Durotheca rogersii]|uniref:uncharacterized protein n=1 Tax=Durotheca rogersii TaxID=419775 RepID=UPI00221F3278|nr:uncharacterized protein GGS23DRAFT_614380 [Durotheca rogersii]KAI5859920.1 hypothetical protein GGS23DRAFT_614380 [Durotheca rogersii]
MVYCGKPSRGCQMCRTRRIKCDETKPKCNQCAKSRRICPGYRDEFDLVFRNETQATERRARKASAKSLTQKAARSQEVAHRGSLSSPPSPRPQAVVPALNVPVEHQARCHFVANFVLVPHQEGTRGFMDFTMPLLLQEPRDHLQYAFNACSMAFLHNRRGASSTLSERALHEYTRALKETNAALRDPATQTMDSTLAAVLLLGLFETISAKQLRMMHWGSHTEGAIQLVKARGRKQLKTKVGLQLFIAVRTQMIVHCLTSGTAPIMGAEWWINDAARNRTAAKCHQLLIKTCELRAELARLMAGPPAPRTPARVEAVLELARRAQDLDRDAVAWMRGVPAGWLPRTVAWVDRRAGGAAAEDYARAEVFPGRVDAYRDFYTAGVWNMARTARLVLAAIVVRCAAWACAPVDYRTTPEYATAARVCVETIADVIASVPYHLGVTAAGGEEEEEEEEEGEEGVDGGVKALAGYFLTWPLANLTSQDYTTDAQRAWIRGRLTYISDALGVRYAHILQNLQIRVPSMLIRQDWCNSTERHHRLRQSYRRISFPNHQIL